MWILNIFSNQGKCGGYQQVRRLVFMKLKPLRYINGTLKKS